MQIHSAAAYRLIRDAWQLGRDRPLIVAGGPKAIYHGNGGVGEVGVACRGDFVRLILRPIARHTEPPQPKYPTVGPDHVDVELAHYGAAVHLPTPAVSSVPPPREARKQVGSRQEAILGPKSPLAWHRVTVRRKRIAAPNAKEVRMPLPYRPRALQSWQ